MNLVLDNTYKWWVNRDRKAKNVIVAFFLSLNSSLYSKRVYTLSIERMISTIVTEEKFH